MDFYEGESEARISEFLAQAMGQERWRRRWRAGEIAGQGGCWGLALGAGLWACGIIGLGQSFWLGVALFGAAFAWGWGRNRTDDPLRVARRVDEQFKLGERCVTWLTVSGEGGYRRALVDDLEARLRHFQATDLGGTRWPRLDWRFGVPLAIVGLTCLIGTDLAGMSSRRENVTAVSVGRSAGRVPAAEPTETAELGSTAPAASEAAAASAADLRADELEAGGASRPGRDSGGVAGLDGRPAGAGAAGRSGRPTWRQDSAAEGRAGWPGEVVYLAGDDRQTAGEARGAASGRQLKALAARVENLSESRREAVARYLAALASAEGYR